MLTRLYEFRVLSSSLILFPESRSGMKEEIRLLLSIKEALSRYYVSVWPRIKLCL